MMVGLIAGPMTGALINALSEMSAPNARKHYGTEMAAALSVGQAL
jgi:hypothetical protein